MCRGRGQDFPRSTADARWGWGSHATWPRSDSRRWRAYARLPGIHDLWLHELSYEDGLIWPRVAGVEWELAEEDRFEGIPEPCFVSEEGVGEFLSANAPLMDDEPNVFEETIAYSSLGESSATVVDHTDDPRGEAGVAKFMLFLQQRAGVQLR